MVSGTDTLKDKVYKSTFWGMNGLKEDNSSACAGVKAILLRDSRFDAMQKSYNLCVMTVMDRDIWNTWSLVFV